MAVISTTIKIDDPNSALFLYDQIQVWKSSVEDGVYTEITSEKSAPARLVGSVEGTWDLDGLILSIELNNAPAAEVAFSGDGLDLQSVLNQINAVFPQLAKEASEDSNTVALETAVLGTRSSLLVSGTAVAVLGLPATKAVGTDKRIPLQEDVSSYLFRDFNGLTTDWYKTRLFSSVSGEVGEFSVSQQGAPPVLVPGAALALATVTLVDISGKPLSGKRIIFIPTSPALVDNGSGVTLGALPGSPSIEVETNVGGYAEVSLIRGQSFRVVFEGTAYTRELVVPDADSFDLLTALGNSPDPFDIAQIPARPIKVTT